MAISRHGSAGSSVSEFGPALFQLLDLLTEYAEGIAGDVFRPAVRSQVAEWRDRTFEILLGQVRLRSLQQIRETSYDMFKCLAQRSLRAKRPAVPSDSGLPEHASLYRSVSYLSRDDYFESPFLSEMARYRDIAFREVFGDPAANGSTVQIQRVLVVGQEHWYASPGSGFRDFWNRAEPAICRLASNSTVRVVSATQLPDSGSSDPILDFGLYGDVAVGVYHRVGDREELLIQDAHSSLFSQCECAWRGLMDPASESIEWTEFTRRLHEEDRL